LREAGELAEASRYAGERLTLAQSLPSTSLDDVASARLNVGGVALPERFHDGVVRVRLADLLSA
jgi:hypothetical protein